MIAMTTSSSSRVKAHRRSKPGWGTAPASCPDSHVRAGASPCERYVRSSGAEPACRGGTLDNTTLQPEDPILVCGRHGLRFGHKLFAVSS
jgi:hypothetical protein